ncbi:pci domain-containing protein [Ophiostoma piceae UAMH 11346]|uniref:Pci domain-containing protein n=1 Tax=Ophiostoma piceae (strain UAMH 11346) TaxID=1262450 RepID=S3C5T5_OPHP1|nr:pci domain-containing protein [Ophiostoma piceae UAMH 11346]
MRNSVVFAALSALGLAQATIANYTIDTASISLTTRSTWCQAQDNTCSTLCDGNPKTETCDPTTLIYSCLCQNGTAPGLEYYTQTLPTFVCNEAFSECITANANNATGQKACTTDIKDNCGTLDPSKYSPAAVSSSSAPASTAAAATSAATASAAGTATPTASSSSNAAPAMNHIGNGAVAVAVGLFAYLL